MPIIAAFAIQDVSSWEKVSEEPRGKRPKFWVKDDRRQWLRKAPRVSRPLEPAIEATTLRLALASGLAAPESRACEWTDDEGSHRGILVARFLDDPLESLAEGIQLLRGRDPAYDPELRGEHTLDRIRAALTALEQDHPQAQLLQAFCDMLFLDAWIGTSDRHQENWGMINFPTGVKLAPIYDTAACLGVELQPEHRLLARVPSKDELKKYVERCSSGFGRGQNHLISQRQVVAELKTSWPAEWHRSKRLIENFGELLGEPLSEYLNTIPQDWLPPERKQLVRALLEKRLEWLKQQ